MILSVFVILLLIKVGKLNSDQQESFNEHHTSFNVNLMKSFIKKILNITTENQKIDEFIANSFRVEKPNPMYIFLFPDKNNRSLIFHRSDFKEMYFPKIPAANKFENKTFNIPSTYKILGMGSKLFKQNTLEQLAQNQFGYVVFENRTNDDVYDSITLQNIRTERNFIQIMNDINDHPESFTKNPVSQNNIELKPIAVRLKSVRSKDNYKSRSRTYKAIVKPPKEFYGAKYTSNNFGNDENDNLEYNDDWDKLGLQGWSGGIREPKTHEYGVERPPRTETVITNIHIGKPENYAPQINFQNSTKTTKINKHRIHQFRHSKGDLSFIESTITKNDFYRDIEIPKISHLKQNSTFQDTHNEVNRQNISELLSKILIEERKEFKQKYKITSHKGSVGVPKFPITRSRDQHLDEYVFIARSNNPFGHSTKWKFNNNSNASANPISMPHREDRRKRGVVDLYSMIKCGTGCDPLIFKGYGCYCGFLGSGRALDGIDRCCAMHDYCYSVSSCPMFLEYFVPYLWKCYKGRPLCATDHGEWGGPGSCASRLCECDRVLAKCLRQYYCPETRAVCNSSPWRLFQKLIMDFGN